MAEKTLVPQETYLKTGAHIGTKFKTGDMKRYIFKRRKDGLNVLDVENIENRIVIAAKFLSEFEPASVVAVSRRLYGQIPVKAFANAIGAKALVGRFVPGTFTNPKGKEFIEPKVVIITDAELDGQAIKEAAKIKAAVIALSSTNNALNNIDLIIPINNKGRKSLALVYWLLAREIMKNRGLIKKDEDFSAKLSDFEYALEGGTEEETEEENKRTPQRRINR